MPAPTAWPIILALGVTLMFAGLLTSASISTLGVILSLAASVGWFREVLPRERVEMVPVELEAARIVAPTTKVSALDVGEKLHRAYLPIEIPPVSAGIKGGLAGSVAMAVLAVLFGVITHHSVWYAINLLGAVVYAHAEDVTTAQLTQFNIWLLLVATAIHLVTSLLVGLLYGAMLPMFPRRPTLFAGFIAPLLWSGLVHSVLGLVNPILNQRISWTWFVASQIAFGIVAGWVVERSEWVRTRQAMPFAERFGLEGPGFTDKKGEGE
jgi:hypothetical protein